MEIVNVYDFDKTILPYDSTEHFFAYCVRRWPRVVGPALRAVPMVPGMKLRWTTKTRVKEVFYRFLTQVPDIDAAVEDFWRTRFSDLNDWYLAQMRPDDIISSASPDFLLRPVTTRLGVRLIASRVDKYSGWREQPAQGKGAALPPGIPQHRDSRVLLRLPLRHPHGRAGPERLPGEGQRHPSLALGGEKISALRPSAAQAHFVINYIIRYHISRAGPRPEVKSPPGIIPGGLSVLTVHPSSCS